MQLLPDNLKTEYIQINTLLIATHFRLFIQSDDSIILHTFQIYFTLTTYSYNFHFKLLNQGIHTHSIEMINISLTHRPMLYLHELKII